MREFGGIMKLFCNIVVVVHPPQSTVKTNTVKYKKSKYFNV